MSETGLVQPATLATLGTEAALDDIKRRITDNDQRLDCDASDKLIYAGKSPSVG